MRARSGKAEPAAPAPGRARERASAEPRTLESYWEGAAMTGSPACRAPLADVSIDHAIYLRPVLSPYVSI